MGDTKLANKSESKMMVVPGGTPQETASKWVKLMRKYVNDNKDICKMTVKTEDSSGPRPLKQFITSSQYKGGWNVLGMRGEGTYTFPSKEVIYEGAFDDGQFHGYGELKYKNGAIIRANWDHGSVKKRQLVFADGLEYTEGGDWKYCKMPDRRWTVEYDKSLRPGTKTYQTAEQPPVVIPEGFYDVGDGYFDPETKVVYRYDNLNAIIRAPGIQECKWNMDNCRKCPDDHVGPFPSLYEDWENPQLELEVPPPPAAPTRGMAMFEKERVIKNAPSRARLKFSHTKIKYEGGGNAS